MVRDMSPYCQNCVLSKILRPHIKIFPLNDQYIVKTFANYSPFLCLDLDINLHNEVLGNPCLPS